MVTKNISMRFQHSPIKTVGGVRKSTKKCLKMTSFWPGTEKRKIGQPRNLYPDATFTPIHLLVKFRDDRTSGTWSKSGNIRTDERTDERTSDYLISENNRTVRCLLISPCPG